MSFNWSPRSCPICGYKKVTVTGVLAGYAGQCRTCKHLGPMRHTRREARAAWNNKMDLKGDKVAQNGP